jgi:hypothetical protein
VWIVVAIQSQQERYGGEEGEHPNFPVEIWKQQVINDGTRLGYWAWVLVQMEETTEGEEGMIDLQDRGTEPGWYATLTTYGESTAAFPGAHWWTGERWQATALEPLLLTYAVIRCWPLHYQAKSEAEAYARRRLKKHIWREQLKQFDQAAKAAAAEAGAR